MSEVDRFACEALARQVWPRESVRIAAGGRTHPAHGLAMRQKGVIAGTIDAPVVLAEAGSWSKLARDLRALRDTKPESVRP